MARSTTTGNPFRYAGEKLPVMRARWSGELGQYARAFTSRVFPAMPPEATVATTISAMGPDDDTTGTRRFHEIGYFQTPAGPVSSPANADPSGDYNTWLSLGRSQSVINMLGREAVSIGWESAIADQTAIGLAALRRYLDRMNLPAAILPRQRGSQWDYAASVMGHVVGSSGARAVIAPHADALARVPESRRFGELVRRLASGAPERRWGFPLVRTWQRLATGEALARTTGGNVAWFDLGLGGDTSSLASAVAEAAYGGGGGGTSGSTAGGVLLAVGLITLGGYLAWPYLQREMRPRRGR